MYTSGTNRPTTQPQTTNYSYLTTSNASNSGHLETGLNWISSHSALLHVQIQRDRVPGNGSNPVSSFAIQGLPVQMVDCGLPKHELGVRSKLVFEMNLKGLKRCSYRALRSAYGTNAQIS